MKDYRQIIPRGLFPHPPQFGIRQYDEVGRVLHAFENHQVPVKRDQLDAEPFHIPGGVVQPAEDREGVPAVSGPDRRRQVVQGVPSRHAGGLLHDRNRYLPRAGDTLVK